MYIHDLQSLAIPHIEPDNGDKAGPQDAGF